MLPFLFEHIQTMQTNMNANKQTNKQIDLCTTVRGDEYQASWKESTRKSGQCSRTHTPYRMPGTLILPFLFFRVHHHPPSIGIVDRWVSLFMRCSINEEMKAISIYALRALFVISLFAGSFFPLKFKQTVVVFAMVFCSHCIGNWK